MKKNNYDLYEKGQEISIVTFQQHQNQVLETVNALVLALGMDPATPAILYGLENTGIGLNYNLSAGAIYANGEIFQVDAFTGTAGPGQEAFLKPVDVPVGDAVTFEDGTVVAVHIDHKYEVELGTPQPGTDEFAYTAADRFSDKLNALLGAKQYTDDELAQLATTMNELRGGGSSATGNGFLLNTISPGSHLPSGSVGNLPYNTTLHFESADIPVNTISASASNPRMVTIFADFFYKRDGSDNDDVDLYIVYREGTSGDWTNLRGKKIRADEHVRTIPFRAQLVLTAPPTSVLQFGIRQLHNAHEHSIIISHKHYIEFDVIY